MSALARFFDSYYRLRPVNATFTGVHDFDDRLPDWSPDGLAAALDEIRGLRTALHDGGATPDLHDTRARDLALAVSFLDVQIAELESAHFQRGNPSLAIGEAAFGIIALITRSFAPASRRVDAVVARLDAIPGFLAGARQSIAGGVPDEWRLKALRECDGAGRVVGDGLDRWLAIEAVTDDRVRPAADRAAAAIDAFRGWLTTEVQAAPAERYAAGSDLLDLLIARGHWCATGRRDLAARVHDALDDALDALDRRARAAAPGGWPEVQERLAGQHPAAAGYLTAFQQTWEGCRAAAVEARLVSWPDYPIRYVPIPAQTRDAAPFLYYLFYRSPAPFDRLRVHDYVVTPIDDTLAAEERERRLRVWNDAAIVLNHVVHHGGLGHHVQNFHAARCQSRIGQVAAVDGASRIGMFSGGTMAEGWACYACDLIEGTGLLTPHEQAAQQHTRVRLAARAVADLELHLGIRSLDGTAALYRERAGLAPDAAFAEAVKNSMFPGAAVMYWLGTRALHQLRREASGRAGASFTLRAFHDRVLQFGSIPVLLIARLMSRCPA